MSQPTIIDTGVVAVGVSAPIWLQWIETYAGAFMALGGCTLVVIRVMIAWRDWKRKHK